MPYIVGIDIGGTFTDCAVVDDEGRVTLGKAPTTPVDPTVGFFDAIADASARLGLSLEELLRETTALIHGTTTGTNAIVAEAGAKVGILTTRGHRDSLIIMNGTGRTAGLTVDQLAYLPGTDKPRPIVPRSRIMEITERVNADGEELIPMRDDEVREAVRGLLQQGAEAIGISFLWSFLNPAHEQRAKEITVELAPGLFVCCSSDLVPRLGEYSRTATVAMNCYIGPLMHRYVESIRARAEALGFRGRLRFSQCNGGSGTVLSTLRAPIHTVQSGPAVGVVGSAYLGQLMGYQKIITADMGGTTFDVGIVEDGEPVVASISILRQYELYLPTVDVQSVGAGGGSIAWIDQVNGGLRVGPMSAGANPGPACYGQGGIEPTVTDADVVMGIINPDNFLGGKLKLDPDKAAIAVERIAKRLGLSVAETAAGISRIVDTRMADQVRRMVVYRGHDPRDFTIFAFGGGGPTHASIFAREVGVRTVVVPLGDMASVWSALGAATGDLVRYFDQSVSFDAPFDTAAARAVIVGLEHSATNWLAEEDVSQENRVLTPSAFLKFRNQVFETEVLLGAEGYGFRDLVNRYCQRYDEIYGNGTGYREAGITMTGLRIRAVGKTAKPRLRPMPEEGPKPSIEALTKLRKVYWSELRGHKNTPVYQGELLRPGNEVDGPAIIELPDTTLTVRPGDHVRVDRFRSLVMQMAQTGR